MACRQIGSMRSVAGLGRAPTSGAASISRVPAPHRAAASAAQSPARLAPTTRTSASLEDEFSDLSSKPASGASSRGRRYVVGDER